MIEAKGVTIQKFADDNGIARATVFNWLKKVDPPKQRFRAACAEYLGVSEAYFAYGIRRAPQKVDVRSQTRPDLVVEESAPKYGEPDSVPSGRMNINPGFAVPVPEPSREQLEIFFRKILDDAEQTPGGFGYLNGLLAQHFDPEVLRRMRDAAT